MHAALPPTRWFRLRAQPPTTFPSVDELPCALTASLGKHKPGPNTALSSNPGPHRKGLTPPHDHTSALLDEIIRPQEMAKLVELPPPSAFPHAAASLRPLQHLVASPAETGLTRLARTASLGKRVPGPATARVRPHVKVLTASGRGESPLTSALSDGVMRRRDIADLVELLPTSVLPRRDLTYFCTASCMQPQRGLCNAS